MKILISSKEISNIIFNSISKYDHISFAVAWASAHSRAYEQLLNNKHKLALSTVGLHFYQTHPDFIENFLDDERIKFILQEDGVFHPKIYLFWNNETNWIALIGSANFTQSALTKNTEIMTLVESNDKNMFQEIQILLKSYYRQAEIFKKEDFLGYKNIWQEKNKRKYAFNDFENFHFKKPLYKSSILSMSWDEYYQRLKKVDMFQDRLLLLKKANTYFQNYSFENMSEEVRKNVAGINKNNDEITDWRLFGGMNMARLFVHRINDRRKEIDGALEYISVNKSIQKNDYLKYIQYFQEATGWGYGISTISRLLAMKRPDSFFCLTEANEEHLMKDFGYKKQIKNTKDYERYWQDIIEPVRQSPWYNSPEPSEKIELQAWKGRVAMMDALFL